MHCPAAPPHATVDLSDLQSAVHGRWVGVAVEVGEHLRGGLGGHCRRQYDVACCGARARLVAELSSDARPGGIAIGAVQIVTAPAGRATGQHERSDHSGDVTDLGEEVYDATAHQSVGQVAETVAFGGEHDEVGLSPASGECAAQAGCQPPCRADRGVRASCPDVRRARPGRRDVISGSDARVVDNQRSDTGGCQQRRDRGTYATRAAYGDDGVPSSGEHRDSSVARWVGEGGSSEVGGESVTIVLAECGQCSSVGRGVVEDSGAVQEGEQVVGAFFLEAEALRDREYAVAVASAVEGFD
jgi:hypothetical protein